MLSELSDKGWTVVDPPLSDDPMSVVARYRGEPIKVGLKTKTVENNESMMHEVYRTGCYDVEIRIDFDIGRGQIKVSK